MSLTMRLWFLFFHILAGLWLGAGIFASAVVRAQARRAADLATRAASLLLAWRLMAIYTLPGLIVVGLLGLHLVGTGGYAMSAFWIQATLGVYLLMLVVILFYLTPRARRAKRAAEESLAAGAPTAEFERLAGARLPGILSDVMALAVVVLTLLMVLKPS